MSATRYTRLFSGARREARPVIVPFVMLGFPDAAGSLAACEVLIAAGADALELGLPFSDAVADGPVIQQAARSALAGGFRVAEGFALMATLRARHPALPLGLLTYANLVEARGATGFAREAAGAGLDSVLIADLPVSEAQPWLAAARAAGVAPVLIAPPDLDVATRAAVAREGAGYTYLVGRRGVTGAHAGLEPGLAERVRALDAAGAPPCLVGFGITGPADVALAHAAGAAGVIVGSLLVEALARSPATPAVLGPVLSGLRRWPSPQARC